METRLQEVKKTGDLRNEMQQRPPRFRIVKLEERIAPSHGHHRTGSGGRSC
jgi:hypothetical protein